MRCYTNYYDFTKGDFWYGFGLERIPTYGDILELFKTDYSKTAENMKDIISSIEKICPKRRDIVAQIVYERMKHPYERYSQVLVWMIFDQLVHGRDHGCPEEAFLPYNRGIEIASCFEELRAVDEKYKNVEQIIQETLNSIPEDARDYMNISTNFGQRRKGYTAAQAKLRKAIKKYVKYSLASSRR